MKFKQHSIAKLISNKNPGIEHEIAVAFHLMGKKQKEDEGFYSNVVMKHPESTRIIDSIENLKKHSEEVDWPDIFAKFRNEESYYVSLAASQDDDLGPADVLICCFDEIQFGVSVKFENKNNWNPSGRKHFIDQNDKEEFEQLYEQKYLQLYLSYMEETYGKCEHNKDSPKHRTNWCRINNNPITDEYIDPIRDRVITRWNEKKQQEKIDILNKAGHVDVPIDYFILFLYKKKCAEISRPRSGLKNTDDIHIEKYGNSSLCFYINGELTDKLQVKANCGFIERAKKKDGTLKKVRNSFTVNDIEWGHGEFFGSWDWTVN